MHVDAVEHDVGPERLGDVRATRRGERKEGHDGTCGSRAGDGRARNGTVITTSRPEDSPVASIPVMNAPDRVETSTLALDDDGEAIGLRVVDARHAGEQFARARLVDVDLVRCDLSGCDFSESVWQRVTLTDCRASGIDLAQASLGHVTFDDCRLDDANLRLARLHAVRFHTSVLAGADFTGRAGRGRVVHRERPRGRRLLERARGSAGRLTRGARAPWACGHWSLVGPTIDFDQLFGFARDPRRRSGSARRRRGGSWGRV